MTWHGGWVPSRALVAVLLALVPGPAPGQQSLPVMPPAESPPAVLSMADAGGTLRLEIGHFRLLQADEPLGTIIIGNETIAKATLGSDHSVIVTGLGEGSTNLIVLGESQETLMSSLIVVSPVSGPVPATVIVMKGASTREYYECIGRNCVLVDAPTLLAAPTPDEGRTTAGQPGGATE